ncbi:MAG TPA: Lrp/AsnC family transcriptional regulator [Thermomicrobiales bacterium]|nr:Lrp/AsnC family transcriptional regulator [Thermomicrobiales bacterium]
MVDAQGRGPGSVDELDLRIIGALETDGRRPVADIARELGVPKSTVQRRLDALIRERVILVAAYADSGKLGLGIHAHLNMRVDLASYQQAIDKVRQLTEVRWLAVTTGRDDLTAEGYFASPTHLHEFIRDKLAPIPGIIAVETAIILSVEKLTFHWGDLLREAADHVNPHLRPSALPESFQRVTAPTGSHVP